MSRRLAPCLLLALLACGSASSHAVSFTHNDITLDINGTINGFYSHRSAESGGVKTTNSALTNGLLPGWINFVFTTKVDGLDIKAHVGFAPGINDKSDVVGLPSVLHCLIDPEAITPTGTLQGIRSAALSKK